MRRKTDPLDRRSVLVQHSVGMLHLVVLMANPRHKLDYDFSVEQYLKVLDEHGVHFAVIAEHGPDPSAGFDLVDPGDRPG